MFHTHTNHLLQPTIDLIESSAPTPEKKTLLKLAYDLVFHAPNLYQCDPFQWYSVEEKEKAKALLKRFGYGHLCNLSARWKRQTLERIEAEQKSAGNGYALRVAAGSRVVEEC